MSSNLPLSSTSSTNIHGFDPRIVRYGSIFLLIVGTFGNIVSFIIFSFGTLRRSSTFRYLAILSLMDLVVLYSGLLDLFLMMEYGGNFSLRTLNPVSCRLHTFITYWSQHSSSWILSFISVDRAIATNCIKFARKFCTPRSAGYIVAVIVIVMALFNCHELIFLRLQDTSSIETTVINSTTLSSLRSSTLSTRYFLSNTKKIPKRAVQSFLSICDKTPWNIFCQRTKRDLPEIKSKPNLKRCEPLQESLYAKAWDHVSER